MDFKVCDTVKRLNALRHQTASKQKKLEDLQTQYNQMMKDASEAIATDQGESQDAQVCRAFLFYVLLSYTVKIRKIWMLKKAATVILKFEFSVVLSYTH